MDRLLWTEILDMGPPARMNHAMAYDSDRDQVVLFGGLTEGVDARGTPGMLNLQDTWEFDGSIWMQAEDMGPPARSQHGMCYDTGRKRTVLFGGGGNGLYNDTWEWDGEVWTQVADNGPPAGVGFAMCYDVANRYVLYLSYAGVDPRSHATTWSWDGSEWTQLDDNGAGAKSGIMAYDAISQQVLLCTDSNAEPRPQPRPPTLVWTGSSWRQVSDIGVHINAWGANICFDGQEVILYLPGPRQTWTWMDSRWVQRQDMGPSSRTGPSLVGDLKRQRSLLYGGKIGTGPPETVSTVPPETWALRRLPLSTRDQPSTPNG